MTIQRRLALLPAIPISGAGDSEFQPIWAGDVADCTMAALERDDSASTRYELAGPEVLTYDQMARTIARVSGHERPLVHVPLGARPLWPRGLRRTVGDAAFATWEEAELMEVPMVSDRGDADVRELGVEPLPMARCSAVSRLRSRTPASTPAQAASPAPPRLAVPPPRTARPEAGCCSPIRGGPG